MKQLTNCYSSTPVTNASKMKVSLEYIYLLPVTHLMATNSCIFIRMEDIGDKLTLESADIFN